ncbi:MAG: alpha-glucosidase [Spirochaetaceae bacterium]
MNLVSRDEESWWKDAAIYQIYPRSFLDSNGDGIGDIQGIRERVPYLRRLGVDAVWLTPIYESPNADWGYDVSNYRAIDPTYGTVEELDQLLEELHRAGIRLIMDLVVNHTSTEHPWFVSSLADPGGAFASYYIWRKGRGSAPPNNWDSYFGGSAWEYRSEREAYYLHLFSPGQADLNWENREVRQEVYQIMNWWFDRGIDGFRMDVINMISKEQSFPDDERILEGTATRGTPYFVNGPRLHEFMREMRREVLHRPGVAAIGECPGATIEELRSLAGLDRSELDTAMHMELMELDHGPGGKWDIRPWSRRELAETISRWQSGLEGLAWPANFLSNHDQPRGVSRFGEDRRYRRESAKMLAALLLTQTGTPFIYQGEEIGMPNAGYREIDHYQDVDSLNYYGIKKIEGKSEGEILETVRYMSRDNARSPMQWRSEPKGGFTSGTPWIPMGWSAESVSVADEENAPESVLEAYRELLALRKAEPALRRGSFRRLDLPGDAVFGITKSFGETVILVLLNLGSREEPLEAEELPEELSDGPDGLERLWGNYERSGAPERLAPFEAVIYRLTGG